MEGEQNRKPLWFTLFISLICLIKLCEKSNPQGFVCILAGKMQSGVGESEKSRRLCGFGFLHASNQYG